MNPPTKPRVLSGIQPSGTLHLGNYLGAVQQWVTGQQRAENFFCIVDLHAITVYQDPRLLREQTLNLAAELLAAGIDPDKSTLFVQSHVRAHAEACWLMNCVAPIGWLERMIQYKAKAAKQESVLMGLLDYPVLQTVDILLYSAHEVPVGDDQRQHIELARDLALRFNAIYGETFVVPQGVYRESGARIMGLNDPTIKMSKSEAASNHSIRLVDEPDIIQRAFKVAVTDSGRDIVFSDDPEKAGVNNLLQIYELLSGQTRDAIEAHFAGQGYGALKREVAEVTIEALRPMRERYRELRSNPDELMHILHRGAEQARAVAEPMCAIMRERMGLISALPNKHNVRD